MTCTVFRAMPAESIKGPAAAGGIALINAIGLSGGFWGPCYHRVGQNSDGRPATWRTAHDVDAVDRLADHPRQQVACTSVVHSSKLRSPPITQPASGDDCAFHAQGSERNAREEGATYAFTSIHLGRNRTVSRT
jgi:hypothetical protein